MAVHLSQLLCPGRHRRAALADLPAAGQESGRVIFSSVNSILQQYSILSGIKLQCLYFGLSTLFHLKGWQASTFQSFQKCVLVFRQSKGKCHFKSLNANSVSWNDICRCHRCNYLAIVHDRLFFQHQQTYISWCMWLIHIFDIWSFSNLFDERNWDSRCSTIVNFLF